MLASECDGFNRWHFIVASDPMRIVSVPHSLNATTGLVCVPVGDRKSLERLVIEDLAKNASFSCVLGTWTALDLFNAHPEPTESTLLQWCGAG